MSETARALDMPRSNLYKKIERYGLGREAEARIAQRCVAGIVQSNRELAG